MKRQLIAVGLALSVASVAGAQIGKTVPVGIGTPEDAAITEINKTPDGPDKVALLDKFMADFGKGDFELLGDQMYVQTYLAQKNYAKVFEYGDKALALDPNDFATAVNMVHAADEQGDTGKIFDQGEKVSAIIARYKASPPALGVAPDQWKQKQEETLNNAQADIGYVEYAMVNAAFKTTDPAARAALFERYMTAFSDSAYSPMVREQTAVAYQQAQNTPKMLATAQSILTTDPNNISMLLLLADYWSENGLELDHAAANAQKALTLIPDAKKPDNVTDDQWQQQVSLQKGIAYISIGEVDAYKERNEQAIEAFQQASPLLKANKLMYARNLYLLGFTLAKMRRLPEARTVLKEVISIDSPYKSRAQQTLNKIGGAVPGRHARNSS